MCECVTELRGLANNILREKLEIFRWDFTLVTQLGIESPYECQH
jgi:hypothetical protein